MKQKMSLLFAITIFTAALLDAAPAPMMPRVVGDWWLYSGSWGTIQDTVVGVVPLEGGGSELTVTRHFEVKPGCTYKLRLSDTAVVAIDSLQDSIALYSSAGFLPRPETYGEICHIARYNIDPEIPEISGDTARLGGEGAWGAPWWLLGIGPIESSLFCLNLCQTAPHCLPCVWIRLESAYYQGRTWINETPPVSQATLPLAKTGAAVQFHRVGGFWIVQSPYQISAQTVDALGRLATQWPAARTTSGYQLIVPAAPHPIYIRYVIGTRTYTQLLPVR